MERLFIGLATTRYSAHPDAEDRPELADGLCAMRDLFVEFGYTDVPGFGTDLSAEQLRARLGAILRDPAREPDDVVAFYYTGHGVLEDDFFALLFPETTEDVWRTGVAGAELATWLLGGTVVRRVLIMLDTCHAGAGGIDLVSEAMGHLKRQRPGTRSIDTAVVWGARPAQKAESLAFTNAFIEAVQHPASGGVEPEYLPLDYIVDRITEAPPAWQKAGFAHAGGGVGVFLPNPRFDPSVQGFDLRTRSDEQEKLRAQEMQSHVWPRAQGLDAPAQGQFLFTGRTAALRFIGSWLAEADSHLIVTGGPGSGKSSLLARIFVLSDPKKRARIPQGNLAGVELPDVTPIARFIHARGMTATELLAGLCEAVQVEARTVADLVAKLRERSGPPVTLIVDAVDEAANGREAVGVVLAPLLRSGVSGRVRVLIGTREHLVDSLPAQSINVDDSDFADPASITEYARRCLVDLVPDGPYRRRPEAASQVADAVGIAAGTSFLVALIVARALALRSEVVPRPDDEAWRRTLPGRAAEAMQFDIDERLGDRAADARNLMRPLAYAQGMGLPWENVWSAVASAIANCNYSDDDIEWLVREAGYYIIETKEAQRSSYRLFHESLAEHLRDIGETEVHRRIVQALRRLVPSGIWRNSHPYIRRHFAGHAASAGVIDDYMTDPEFLVSADRGRLLTAALSTRTLQGRRAAIAFQQASQASSGDFASRASVLELAAHQYRADELAAEIKRRGIPRPWSIQYANWTPTAPHRVLCRLETPITEIAIQEHDGGPSVVVRTDDAAWVIDLIAGDVLLRQRKRPSTIAGMAVGILAGHVFVPSARRLIAVAADGRGRRRVSLRVKGAIAVRDTVLQGRPVACLHADDGLYLIDGLRRVGRSPWYHSPLPIFLVQPAVVRQQAKLLLHVGTGAVQILDVETRNIEFSVRVGADAVDQLFTIAVNGRNWICAITRRLGWPDLDGILEFQEDAEGIEYGVQRIQCWDAADSRDSPVVEYELHEIVRSVVCSVMEDRPVIITGGDDGLVRIRDADGVLVGELFGHRAPVTSLSIWTSADLESVVVSGGEDGTVRVFDLQRNLFTQNTVVEGPGGQRSLGSHGLLSSAEAPWTKQGVTPADLAIAGSGDDAIAVTAGGEDGALYAWNIAAGKLLDYWFAHAGGALAVTTLRLSGGTRAFTGGGDGTVKAWDVHRGELLSLVWSDPKRRVTALAGIQFGSAGALVVGCDNGDLHLIDLSGRDLAAPIFFTHQVELVVAAESQSKIVVQAGGQLTAVLLQRGSPTGRRPIHLTGMPGVKAEVTSLAHGRASQAWAIATGDQAVHFDIRSGRTAQVEVWSPVQSVEIDDDGLLIVGAADGVAAVSVDGGDPPAPGSMVAGILEILAGTGMPLPSLENRIHSRRSFNTRTLVPVFAKRQEDRPPAERGGAAMLPLVGFIAVLVASFYLGFYLVVPLALPGRSKPDGPGRLGTLVTVSESACDATSPLHGLPVNLCRFLRQP